MNVPVVLIIVILVMQSVTMLQALLSAYVNQVILGMGHCILTLMNVPMVLIIVILVVQSVPMLQVLLLAPVNQVILGV